MIPEAAGDRREERGTYEEHWTDHLSLPQRSRPVSDCAFEKAEGSGGGSELLEHFRLGTWTERALCGNVSVHLQNSRNLGLYRGLLRQQSRRSPLRAECRRKGHGDLLHRNAAPFLTVPEAGTCSHQCLCSPGPRRDKASQALQCNGIHGHRQLSRFRQLHHARRRCEEGGECRLCRHHE